MCLRRTGRQRRQAGRVGRKDRVAGWKFHALTGPGTEPLSGWASAPLVTHMKNEGRNGMKNRGRNGMKNGGSPGRNGMRKG